MSTYRIGAVVLAAGRSTRMGARNKLALPLAGKPIVLHAIDAAIGCGADPVVVVTGHDHGAISRLVAGRRAEVVHNGRHARGMAESIKVGIRQLPDDVDGVVICLGDMPRIGELHLQRLMDAFDPVAGHDVCVPYDRGRRGNPVLWGRRHFEDLQALRGDRGARDMIDRHSQAVARVEFEDGAVLTDVDSPGDLRNASPWSSSSGHGV